MKCIPKRWKSGTKKRDRNRDPFLEPASKIPILAGIPRPPKTVPFLGPHFGGGEPLSSSFFGTKIWISYQEVPSNVTSSSARMQLYTSRNSRLDTACLEHIFASKTVKSVDVFSRVAALTVEVPQALGKNLDNFRTHKSGPVERVSGSHASTFSCVQVSRAQCKIREHRHLRGEQSEVDSKTWGQDRSFRRHQLDQIFGIRTDVRKTDRTRAEEFSGRHLQQIWTWFLEICRFMASRGVGDGSEIVHGA